MSLEVLDARIGSIRFHLPSRFTGIPYLIARTTSGSTIKGEMRWPIEGETYRFWGEWKASKNAKYPEPAFEFVNFEVIVEKTADGVSQYLTRYIRGLGEVKSAAIVKHFGSETLDVLRNSPERALEVHGINAEIVESIRGYFEEHTLFDPVAHAKLIELFSDYKVPKKVVLELLRQWKSDAPRQVIETPYMLRAFPRMGWKTVDSFALTTAKYAEDGIDRHKWAIVEALERLANQGHTVATKIDVEELAFQLLAGRPRADAWAAGIAEQLIVEIDDGSLTSTGEYALKALYSAEVEIAEQLALLSEAARPLKFPLAEGPAVEGLVDGQRRTLEILEANGVANLIGAAGVGKSLTLARAIAGLVANGFTSIRVAAPTGKAAKRAAELLEGRTGDVEIPCTTIHRMLCPQPSDEEEGLSSAGAKFGRGRDEFGFGKNAENPVEADLIVVDELSMTDVKLGAALLRAVAPGTRLVFVGDPNQLPSVGPGSVLRDQIAGGVPTATLTEVQRTSGRVVRACHAIKDGIVPEPSRRLDPAAGENWLHVEIESPAEIVNKIVEMHVRKYRMFPDRLWDLQVVTPMNAKSPMACANLNRLLSPILKLNFKDDPQGGEPEDQDGTEGDESGPSFKIGDKVVRTKNGTCDLLASQVGSRVGRPIAGESGGDLPEHQWEWNGEFWKLDRTVIVNGDTGIVMDIVPPGPEDRRPEAWVVVEFRTPRRMVKLPYSKCHLMLAYAMTCHRCQGSGFPMVIVPVHSSFYFNDKTGQGLFSREWIYTALSRAEKVLVTVGEFSAIRAAVGRKTIHRRKTMLERLIKIQQNTAVGSDALEVSR